MSSPVTAPSQPSTTSGTPSRQSGGRHRAPEVTGSTTFATREQLARSGRHAA